MPQPPDRQNQDATITNVQALEDAECSLFLREYAAYHADLRANAPEAWTELESERREFDGMLMDGLHDE